MEAKRQKIPKGANLIMISTKRSIKSFPDLKKFEVEVVFVKNEHKTFDCTKKLENFYWFEV